MSKVEFCKTVKLSSYSVGNCIIWLGTYLDFYFSVQRKQKFSTLTPKISLIHSSYRFLLKRNQNLGYHSLHPSSVLLVDHFLRFALPNFWLSICLDFQLTGQQNRKFQIFGRIPHSILWQPHGSTSPIHNTRREQRVACFSIKKFPEKFGSIVCGSPRIFSHEHRHYQRGALSWVFGWTSRSSSALLLCCCCFGPMYYVYWSVSVLSGRTYLITGGKCVARSQWLR